MLMKKNKIMLGDIITTKATAECGEGKTGFILCQHNEDEKVYGVKFNETNPSFNKLQYEKKYSGLLNDNKGLWLEAKDFTITPLLNEGKRKFTDLMIKGYIKSVEAIPKEIERSEAIIKSCNSAIADRVRYNEQQENEIKEHKKSIALLKNQPKPEPDNFCAIYDKLAKHKDIEDIMSIENYIVIKTKDLTYHHTNEREIIPDFNLGAYYIFIPEDLTYQIKIINYKRQMKKGQYFHPCIREEGSVCMGTTVMAGVNNYRKENQLTSLVYLLLNFLKEPNYGTPYKPAIDFRCAQPVTYKTKDILDYLHLGNWRTEEKWDDKLYYEDYIKNIEDDIANLEQKKQNSGITQLENNYIDTLNSRLDDARRYYENNYENTTDEQSQS